MFDNKKYISKEVHYLNRVIRNYVYPYRACGVPKIFEKWLREYLKRIHNVEKPDYKLDDVHIKEDNTRLLYWFRLDNIVENGSVSLKSFKKFCRENKLGDEKQNHQMVNNLETKIGDCIVYEATESRGIMIIGSYDYGYGRELSPARAFVGKASHKVCNFNNCIIYGNFAPGINKARFATYKEIIDFINEPETREYFDFYVDRYDFLGKYKRYLKN